MRRLPVLLILVLMVPSAAAIGTMPVRAELHLDSQPRVEGSLLATSDRAGLELVPPGGSAVGPLLSWDAAEGYHVTRSRMNHGVGFAGAALQPSYGENRSIAFQSAEIGNVSCAKRCEVFLFTLDEPDSAISAAGAARGALRWTQSDVVRVPWNTQGTLWRVDFRAGSFVASNDAEATRLEGMTHSVTGRVGLMIWNATATVTEANGTVTSLRTGTWMRENAGPAGTPIGYEMTTTYVVLLLDGARLVDSNRPLTYFAQDAVINLSGIVSVPTPAGVAHVDGERHAVTRSLTIDGHTQLRLLATRSFLDDRADHLSQPEMRVQAEGQARLVVVDGVRIEPSLDPVQTAAASAGALAALAGLFALAYQFLWTPFYTRVDPATVLQHEARRRMFDAIREQPGITLAQLQRILALARPVARHHARMLEAHGYVRMRGRGRHAGYVAMGAQRAPEDTWSVQVLLRDETRRRIAEALASAARPLTQKELSAATGASRRLVSHHLARLEDAGLVASVGAQPKQYVAADAMRAHAEPPHPTASS